jgi:hypothetical protein
MEKINKYKAIGGQTKLTIKITIAIVTISMRVGSTFVMAKPMIQQTMAMPININIRLLSICLAILVIF